MSESYFKPSTMLTFSTVHSDGERLHAFFRETSSDALYIDLSEVEQCDSAGLALLIEAKRLSRQYHKTLTIKGMPRVVLSLATFCGVESMLE